MAKWLAPVLGVVVIGVVIELITQDSRIGKFIRAIYAFMVLYVIVAPLPQLFHQINFEINDGGTMVNADLVQQIQQTGRQTQIQQTLQQMGYPDALVNIQNDVTYINLGQTVTADEVDLIKQKIGTTGVYII